MAIVGRHGAVAAELAPKATLLQREHFARSH